MNRYDIGHPNPGVHYLVLFSWENWSDFYRWWFMVVDPGVYYQGPLHSPILMVQALRHISPWKKCSNLMQFSKYLAESFLRPLRSKDVRCWILRLRPRNFAIISESLAANLKKSLRNNKNESELWNRLSCLTFSRLAAKLSEMIAKFRGLNLKIQHWTSFDLNGLKNGSAKYLKNCIKLLHFSQGLIWHTVWSVNDGLSGNLWKPLAGFRIFY